MRILLPTHSPTTLPIPHKKQKSLNFLSHCFLFRASLLLQIPSSCLPVLCPPSSFLSLLHPSSPRPTLPWHLLILLASNLECVPPTEGEGCRLGLCKQEQPPQHCHWKPLRKSCLSPSTYPVWPGGQRDAACRAVVLEGHCLSRGLHRSVGGSIKWPPGGREVGLHESFMS